MKIIITTSSFGKYDRLPLDRLEEKKIEYTLNPYGRQLTELENVILTPHIGSYAKELRIQMEIEAVENLIRGLNES